MHTCSTHSTAAILANAIVKEPINSKTSTKSAYRLAPCKNSGKSELLNFVKSRLTCASTYTCLPVAEKKNVWPISLVRECAVKNGHFLPLLFPFGNRTVQKLDDGQFFGLFWYKTRDFLFVSGSSFELKSKAIIWEKLKIEPRKTLHFVTTVTQFYRQQINLNRSLPKHSLLNPKSHKSFYPLYQTSSFWTKNGFRKKIYKLKL